jgi:hypothetical protein
MEIDASIRLDRQLADLQKASFGYFLHETNPRTGLVADRTRCGSPASIAAVGMALTAYPVGVECGFCSRETARQKTLAVLRFLWNCPQDPERDAAGYKGFFYHFLDMESGRRVWKCELSTIDTALLMAGVLAAGLWFNHDSADEAEIRDLADRIYRRVDWRWALNDGATISHGWRPERGFLRYRWAGYDEALILYLLALGSPTFPIPPESYDAWLSTYRWKRIYGREFAYAGPLFIHQFSHIWVDFRGIRDAFMRDHGSDYFDNSRAATYVQHDYAMRNPGGFAGYGATCWGFTASDGPGRLRRRIGGRDRRFFSYHSRGAPFGPDDGTISPWAAVASLPFAPEIVLPVIRHFHDLDLHMDNPYGFTASFNPTLAEPGDPPTGWIAPDHVGINQGPIVLMLENCRTGFVWSLMRRSPHLVEGLRRAGFGGGWL